VNIDGWIMDGIEDWGNHGQEDIAALEELRDVRPCECL